MTLININCEDTAAIFLFLCLHLIAAVAREQEMNKESEMKLFPTKVHCQTQTGNILVDGWCLTSKDTRVPHTATGFHVSYKLPKEDRTIYGHTCSSTI